MGDLIGWEDLAARRWVRETRERYERTGKYTTTILLYGEPWLMLTAEGLVVRVDGGDPGDEDQSVEPDR